jgi:type I restriction enzyme, S subunit
MSEWKSCELGLIPANWKIKSVDDLIAEEIIEKPLDGNHGGIHPKGSDFVESGIPFIMASDVNNGKVDLIKCKFITKAQADKLQKGFSKTGDVLLTHKASLGRTALVPNIGTPYIMLTPQVTYYRIKNKMKYSNFFLKYYFDSPGFQGILHSHGSSGSTRAYIGITAQRDLPVLFPPLPEQKAIAEVLSSLDDKIDLLHRQNKTLEQMAETLFRQWFRPPGPLKGEDRVESEKFPLGDLEAKDDWEEGTLDFILKLSNGKSRPNSVGIIPVYGGNGILNYTDQFNYEGESVIIGRVGAYCGSLYFENQKIWISDNALHAIAKQKNQNLFLFYLLKQLNLNSLAEGSSHPLLTQTLLNSIDIIIPPESLRVQFNYHAKIINEKQVQNNCQIQTLEKLRDTLLPKLMSGQVRVTE